MPNNVTTQQIIIASRALYPLEFAVRQAKRQLRSMMSAIWADSQGMYLLTIYPTPGTDVPGFLDSLNELENVKWSGSENFYGRFLEASPITDLETG